MEGVQGWSGRPPIIFPRFSKRGRKTSIPTPFYAFTPFRVPVCATKEAHSLYTPPSKPTDSILAEMKKKREGHFTVPAPIVVAFYGGSGSARRPLPVVEGGRSYYCTQLASFHKSLRFVTKMVNCRPPRHKKALSVDSSFVVRNDTSTDYLDWDLLKSSYA